jgi:imidazolonepropionase-like amidohydrolase
MTILVQDNKIASVEHSDQATLPKDCIVIDGTNRTLMPGLIDAHLHLYSPFTYSVNLSALRQLRRQLFLNQVNTIDNGITTVCDMGGPPGLIEEFKSRVDKNEIPGPRSLNCFTLLSPRKNRTRGYPVQVRQLNLFQSWLMEGQVASRPTTLKELERTCSRIRDRGGDHLKMTYQAHSFSSKKEDLELPLFSDEWTKAIFKCARQAGISVSIHAPYKKGINKCIELAIQTGTRITLQHACCDAELDDQVLAKMKDYGIFQIPTLSVYGDAFRLPQLLSTLDTDQKHNLTQEARRQLRNKIIKLINLEPMSGKEVLELDTVYFRQQFELVCRNTLKAHEARVIGFGTDTGGTYTGFFGRLVDEAEHYANLGISSAMVLRYITAINAEINNLNDRGVIQPNKLADLILVNGSPLHQLDTLKNIYAVMKNGRLVKYDNKGSAMS